MGETAGQAIGRHMDVDKVAFTGSSEVGKFFLVYAGQSNMKSVQLECGGKSPNVVFADVPDVDLAVAESAEGIFGNSGPGVQRRLAAAACRRRSPTSSSRSSRARPSSGCPATRSTRARAWARWSTRRRWSACSATSRRAAARAPSCAPAACAPARRRGGFYVEPTIFGGARNDMRIAQEEIFGPVVTAIPFGSEEDGIRIANDTIYGLTSGVWTRDINKAHRFARAVRSGTVCINCYDRGDNSLPVRRLQAVGHRPRQVAARARELHPAQDDVHQRPPERLARVAPSA